MKPASESQTSTTPHVFVNCTHPSQRHQKERRFLIQSHVSGHYRRKTKQIVLSSPRARSWQLPGREEQSHSASPPHIPDSFDHAAADVKHRRPHSADPHSERLECYPRRDPSDAYPNEARGCVPAAFDHYNKAFVSAHGSVWGENNAYLNKLVPLARQHPVLYEGLLAFSQCLMTTNGDLGCPHEESLYHRGQALKLLRHSVRSLTTPPDDALIWTSVLLLGIDSVYRDQQSWEAHMNGLIGMVELRGGLDRIEPTLRTVITKARAMGVLMTDKAFTSNEPTFDLPFHQNNTPSRTSSQASGNLHTGFRR